MKKQKRRNKSEETEPSGLVVVVVGRTLNTSALVCPVEQLALVGHNLPLKGNKLLSVYTRERRLRIGNFWRP